MQSQQSFVPTAQAARGKRRASQTVSIQTSNQNPQSPTAAVATDRERERTANIAQGRIRSELYLFPGTPEENSGKRRRRHKKPEPPTHGSLHTFPLEPAIYMR
jgi:DNA polymerase IIIc chi subunit